MKSSIPGAERPHDNTCSFTFAKLRKREQHPGSGSPQRDVLVIRRDLGAPLPDGQPEGPGLPTIRAPLGYQVHVSLRRSLVGCGYPQPSSSCPRRHEALRGGYKPRKGSKLGLLHSKSVNSGTVMLASAVFFFLGWLKGTIMPPHADTGKVSLVLRHLPLLLEEGRHAVAGFGAGHSLSWSVDGLRNGAMDVSSSLSVS